MVLGLATSNKIWLALFAGVFIVFALLSAFVFPRWRPDFPGEQGRKWFIIATLALFVAMLFAVNVFAKEDEENRTARRPARSATTTEPGATESTPTETTPTETTPGTAQGDPAAGKALFTVPGLRGLSCVRGRGHERHCRAEPRRGPAGQGRGVHPRVDRRPERRDCPGLSAGGHAGRLRPEALGEADRGPGRFSLAELAKRRGRDSNPRPTFPQVRDFQSRSLGQLGHLSEVGHISSDFRRCQCGPRRSRSPGLRASDCASKIVAWIIRRRGP